VRWHEQQRLWAEFGGAPGAAGPAPARALGAGPRAAPAAPPGDSEDGSAPRDERAGSAPPRGAAAQRAAPAGGAAGAPAGGGWRQSGGYSRWDADSAERQASADREAREAPADGYGERYAEQGDDSGEQYTQADGCGERSAAQVESYEERYAHADVPAAGEAARDGEAAWEREPWADRGVEDQGHREDAAPCEALDEPYGRPHGAQETIWQPLQPGHAQDGPAGGHHADAPAAAAHADDNGAPAYPALDPGDPAEDPEGSGAVDAVVQALEAERALRRGSSGDWPGRQDGEAAGQAPAWQRPALSLHLPPPPVPRFDRRGARGGGGGGPAAGGAGAAWGTPGHGEDGDDGPGQDFAEAVEAALADSPAFQARPPAAVLIECQPATAGRTGTGRLLFRGTAVTMAPSTCCSDQCVHCVTPPGPARRRAADDSVARARAGAGSDPACAGGGPGARPCYTLPRSRRPGR